MLLSVIEQADRKMITELYNTMNQMDLNDIYRALHQTTAKQTLFSSTYRTLIKIDYVLNHKISLNIV